MILNTSDDMAPRLLISILYVAFRWQKTALFSASVMPGCKDTRKSKKEAYARKHGTVHSEGQKAKGKSE